MIEFLKRGLPHAHFLLILAKDSKLTSSDKYDSLVSAELPDAKKNPHFTSMVLKHMIHGLCGSLNPTNVCMKNGQCKNHYPKLFTNITTVGEKSYPIYRRRDDGKKAHVRNKLIDNQWVIPYNPYLLAKYDCHINVEICSTIKAVKYLYKYIYKGHDRVSFHISEVAQTDTIDELKQFQNARWVSTPEAMWRIYQFPRNEISPPVIKLQLHLENSQIDRKSTRLNSSH